jgi:hypothetical protein
VVIQHDGKRPADIGGRRLAEALRARTVQGERDVVAAILIERRVGLVDVAAGDDRVEQDHLRLALLAVVRQGDTVIARYADRIISRIRLCIDHVEGQDAGRGQQLDKVGDARRIEAGNLDQNARIALFGDVRLGQADLVDAALHSLARGVHGVDLQLFEVLFGELDLDGPVRPAVDRVLIGGAQRLQAVDGPLRVRGIGDADDDGVGLRVTLADRDQRRLA